MTILRAGVARKVISPPVGIYLMGYGNRVQGNIGIHDNLYVTALVLDDTVHQAAILTVDHTFINSRIVEQIKARIYDQCEIEADAIFVCCSHSHAGPIGYADEQSRPEDRAYINFLVESLVDSTREALANIHPVTLQAAADEARVNINRRERTSEGKIIIGSNPEGLVDHSVQVVQVVQHDNQVIATLVNYACHPVVMGPLNRMVSADWVGAMRQTVEGSIPGLCLFIQGATADLNPRKMRWTTDNWDEVEEQGNAVGKAVIRACATPRPLDAAPIRFVQSAEWLKLLPATGYTEQLRAFLPEAKTDDEIRAAIHAEFPWHTELEERADGLYTPMPVGALRIGDFALAVVATEPFTETGLALKAASPARMTFVAGYTNGCTSYLPPASLYADGGYEVETAPLFYGLPAPFIPGSAEQVTESLRRMLQTI